MDRIVFFEVSASEGAILKKSPIAKLRPLMLEKRAEDVDPSVWKNAEIVSVFVYSQLTAEWLKKAKRLRLVATRSTGFDHIDLAACQKRGILVSNVPTYGENTVAEHTFALILALSRKTRKAYLQTLRGDVSMEGLRGFDLYGKTLGVVGTGHIGLHVIRIARGFGMQVVAFDPFPNPLIAEVLGFHYAPFEEVLRRSDILTLHAPYNPRTHHMINQQNIRKMKRGALLINTARGGLVETGALVQALDQGILSGAGLDVLEEEDLIKEERQILSREFPVDRLKTLLQTHILIHREDVIITPHIGFNSREAFGRILETTVQNILAFREGRPQNVVNPPSKK